jgi:hypothetical protein
MIAGLVFAFASACATLCHAACIPQHLASPAPRDPVARVLALEERCPKSAPEFVAALQRGGARMEPTMVNFVGFNNPDGGAFFIFEIVSSAGAPPSALVIERGDLLFGHFTVPDGDNLISVDSGLAVELIAWDPDKQFYNFYELVDGNWAYRGDSKEILDDVRLLHRQRSASTGPFGSRLRCSRCHVNGGPIQKELAPPHNDWFTRDRPLPPLRALTPDGFVAGRLTNLVDAGELSKLVDESARRLADSPGYRRVFAARSMQERLRPLFCPMELNIESDAQPFDDHRSTLRIPTAFFVDPRLATAEITVQRQHYDAALAKLGSKLPSPDNRTDADHGWLTPVKANSDAAITDSLIAQGIIDKEFATAVLAVDFTNPVFSTIRCGLLKLVPDNGGPDFVARFKEALRGAAAPGAADLLNNLSDPSRTAAFHGKAASDFLASCQRRAADADSVFDWLRLLAQRRVEVSASEISQNPRPTILEKDPDHPENNRVVFPSTQPQAAPGGLVLTPACQVH